MKLKDQIRGGPKLGKTVEPNHGVFQITNYQPHENQIAFHKSRARHKIACCGRRFGKSVMGAKELETYLFQENCIFWIVAPTYVLGEKEFRIIYKDLMQDLGLINMKGVKQAYNARMGNMYIQFPWNTELIVKSAEDSKGLVGEGLHGVLLAEAAKLREDVWERLIEPALTDFRGFSIQTSTPEGKNWFYKQYMIGVKGEDPDYESWQLPSWKNPYVYPRGRKDPEIRKIKKRTDKVVFEQEYEASFTAFKGQVYSEFREGTHIIDDYEYNPDWPNYQFWDFGYVNALACIDVQISPDDTVYIWRELYETEMRLEDAIDMLKNMDHPEGYRINCAFGDSADPEAIETINQKWSPCDADDEAKENWRDGISLVKKFLKPRKGLDGKIAYRNDKPVVGLYVDSKCVNTIDEFINYKTANKTRATANDPKEVPLKKNDHIMDCLRYGLMHLYKLGAYNLAEVYAAEREFIKVTDGPLSALDMAYNIFRPAGRLSERETGIFNYNDMAEHF